MEALVGIVIVAWFFIVRPIRKDMEKDSRDFHKACIVAREQGNPLLNPSSSSYSPLEFWKQYHACKKETQ